MGNMDDGYSTEEDTKTFEGERRFSNYIMFLGAFSMVVIFFVSNVIQYKKMQEKEKKSFEPTKSTTTYTGKADIGGSWLLYDTEGNPVTHTDF